MPDERPLRVHVLALHGCTPIVPVGLIGLVRRSAELAGTVPARRPRPRVEVALVSTGERRTVTAAGGLVLRCDATLRTAGRCDVAVVPALDPDVFAHLERNRAAVPWIRRV